MQQGHITTYITTPVYFYNYAACRTFIFVIKRIKTIYEFAIGEEFTTKNLIEMDM
jgi:hypothetical protein